MTPVFCRVKHDPESGRYGDCLRACVASMLDMEANPEAVPHFAHDGASADVVNERLRQYLTEHHGLAPWWAHYDPDLSLAEVLEAFKGGGGPHFMLFGQTADGGDHVVICRDGAVAHDPAWWRVPLAKPGSHGAWSVLVFARL